MQKARKEGRKQAAALSPSPFNVDFKSQIATHERESCVLKHERRAREGEGERGNNIYALGTERAREGARVATANVVSSAQ